MINTFHYTITGLSEVPQSGIFGFRLPFSK
jgi:hypothetical protein